MADERDGVFGTGTFDNARFDSVYATSNASLFSASGIKVLLKPSSFLSAFSQTGRVFALSRRASSFANVYSSSDRVIALSRATESHVGTVFSTISSIVKQFSLSFSSHATVFSDNRRVFVLDRAASSFANVYSDNSRVASYARQLSSFANVYSTNSKVVSYFRRAESHVGNVVSGNSLLVRLKPSSFVDAVGGKMRVLTSAPAFTGSLRTYLDTSNIDLSLDTARIWLRDDD